MNGFTNAILSLLLGWIRLLINQGWKLLTSDTGSRIVGFFSANWKILLLILCVGGFVVDRLVYLLRWRPYYVWRNKRLRRRRQREEAFYDDDASPQTEPYENAAADDVVPDNPYAPPVPPFQPAAPAGYTAQTAVYAPVGAFEQTRVYPQSGRVPAVDTAFAPQAASGYRPVADAASISGQPYAPPDELSPVFDDDMPDWSQGDTLVQPQGLGSVTQGMEAAFGTAMPEPVDYIRDMQAGFAKPVPPEQLYAPVQLPVQPVSPDPQAPVHPGLDMDNFRRNIGLSPAGSLDQPETPDFHAFAPAWQAAEEDAVKTGRRNPFSSLAKKARDFVGVSNEDDPRSIRDLHSTVDRRTAFHDPVYPKPRRYKEDDDSSNY